jgi:hypothetical protein
MNVYNKKQLPSWMMMNDQTSKHWMTSGDVDMEMSEREIQTAIKECPRKPQKWDGPLLNPDLPRIATMPKPCNDLAMKKPELRLKHQACEINGFNLAGMKVSGCDMYNYLPPDVVTPSRKPVPKTILPEYAHCLQPGGMKYTDCQMACYAYPEQGGVCETLTKGLSQTQRRLLFQALKSGKPVEPPPPATEVNVEATLKSVKPGVIEISYVDPNTNTPKVVTKTLVDMYKPNDKVSVIIAKPAGTFLGFNRK